MIRDYKSNRRWFKFRFQWIWTTITIQIRFQDNDRVDDRDFDITLIYFWLKDWPKSIKRSKILIKRSKLSIYIKKSIYFDIFNHFPSNLISFWLKSIDFKIFDLFFWAAGNDLESIRIWTTNLDLKSQLKDNLITI